MTDSRSTMDISEPRRVLKASSTVRVRGAKASNSPDGRQPSLPVDSDSANRRVLKANTLRGVGAQPVFQFEDIRKRCDNYVAQVRVRTRKILEEADREAENIRQRAQTEGQQAGLRQGLSDAEQQIERRAAELADQHMREALGTALPALYAAVDSLRAERDRWLAEWETTAVHLCTAIAEKLLRRDVQHTPECLRAMLAETLGMVLGSASIRLRLHPDDLRALGESADEIVRRMASCGEATLVSDETITPGGCIIDTQHGRIDAQVETQLERIASELLQ